MNNQHQQFQEDCHQFPSEEPAQYCTTNHLSHSVLVRHQEGHNPKNCLILHKF
ncbi:hypothetical protein [Candidatus Protochlamydia amoebophila]|uniref:hypothetical protein n=1 Tax=Candidatus Protochlamydia amoebophila TaxID=362787 RepID=UPI0002E1F02D|nr:hypothetical protein [Candidatus Protochlamydia amoebophila]